MISTNFNSHLALIDNIEEAYDNFLKDNNENENLNKIMEQNDGFAELIFSLTEDFYNNSLLNNFKPKEGESNIFSSIILQNKNEYKLITFSSGTKSLANKFQNDNRIYKIKDCHAEILSFRSFKHFIIKCLIFNYICHIMRIIQYSEKIHENDNYIDKSIVLDYLNKENFHKNNFHNYLSFEVFETFVINKDFFEIFEFYQNSKIYLKNYVYFHLYISEIPCGDCSIYPTNYSQDNDMDFNQTGAKAIKEILLSLNNIDKSSNKCYIEHNNNPGVYRSKSMRSDIRRENITASISCSDKILFKNIFGLQGKFLYNLLHPIYISSITISINKDLLNNKESEKKIKYSILRGISLLRRENNLTQNSKNHFDMWNFRKLSFYFNEPKIFLIGKNIGNLKIENKNGILNKFDIGDKSFQGLSIYWYFSKMDVDKIDPNSGFKHGSVVNSNKFNREKSKLDICSIENFKYFIKFLTLYSSLFVSKDILESDLNLKAEYNKLFKNKKIEDIIKEVNELIAIIGEQYNSEVLKGRNKNNIQLDDLYERYFNLIKNNSKYFTAKHKLFTELGINEFLNYQFQIINHK